MSRTERVAVIGVGLLGRGIATVSARCNSRNDAFIKCDVAGGIPPRTAKAQAAPQRRLLAQQVCYPGSATAARIILTQLQWQ